MTTDTSEKGLEALIVADMTAGSWIAGDPKDYNREYAVDLAQLHTFLLATQEETAEALGLDEDTVTRRKFLARLQGEITRNGVIHVLRHGLKHEKYDLALFYGTPSTGNAKAAERFAANRFSVTRQLRYSRDETQNSLDLGLFLNGLPVATFELKNRLTKQTVKDAIEQYRNRESKELLFQFGRCVVHFEVVDREVWMTTHLKGKETWFLPFNKGFDDGAGNPPNAGGIATDYLWKEVLSKPSLAEILEKFAQVVEKPDDKGKTKRRQEFPRYHQLDVVRKLLDDAARHGAGRRYLIQHSAGSGKSNSITWLAHQLVDLKADGRPVFDSIIVVTDRTVLDKQIRDNIRQFAQVSAVVGAVTQGSGQLRSFIEQGKKIIITTVQKFPHIVDDIGEQPGDRTFALLIDEAHSSQGGKTASAMNAALSGEGSGDDEETDEDRINRVIEAKKMLPNASYFAFTATPKNRTLELFGVPQPGGSFRPFHGYTMKQAIQEGFILDVLQNYTPVSSYYRLMKTIEDDPEFDTKRAKKKLRRYVESHDHAIRLKAEIMIDHFHEQVVARNKIGGQARAMVVSSGIERAIQYKRAFDAYLAERKSPYRAIVAFSGEYESDGQKLTEGLMNGFPSAKIPETFAADPYRFLVVADKFQTGFDEPLLHTMYVDKQLSDVKAVQTLSRLNRAHPQKHDTFVLDFINDVETIQEAFAAYYRTTVLSEATDPNKLHDLKADLDRYQVYTPADVAKLEDLDEDGQVDFKSKAKAFVRTYGFLSAILPYRNAGWERLSIFLNFLTPKLPAPKEEDLSKGILDTIDMDSYRVEMRAQMSIALPDEEAEIGPVPTSAGGRKPEPELDRLSNIIRSFNELFGNIEWKDVDKINQVITVEIPAKVAADKAFQNAKQNSDRQNARIEHDSALQRVMMELLSDHTELFKQFSDNPGFKKWLSDTVFQSTYQEWPAASS